MLVDIKSAISIKRSGDCSGEPIMIENCHDSLLLVLDNVASVTIDDCKNCIIILGPCQGSIFIRDCTNCEIFTACQQFRTRDCQMTVHLFCTTAPIIEEAIVKFYPLTINYTQFEEQMQKAGLLGKPNLYKEVQDFTPDISQLNICTEQPTFDFKILPFINVNDVLIAEKVTISQPFE